ncbi:MAG TPA: response regulator [Gammaproteobacteria bacterium]|nr:response regulator [Gammaproteobacteria bacterium]
MQASKRWHLLVIDNNYDAVRYLENLLDESPYLITSINDGEEGFNLLLNEPDKFSAIILGQQILNISSVRLLHRINSCSSLKIIPVIMEASTGTVEEMEICIRAGARYYLPKPIDKTILPKVIDTAVRDQDRYREAEQSTWTSKPLNTLQQATFKIKNLHEAQAVATLLANECPNPRLAAVGISEILINAIEHGNLNITYQEKTRLHEATEWLAEIDRRLDMPENKNKVVTVAFNKTPGHITIRITDEGNGFDWRQFLTLDTNRVFDNHGRGIIMARSLSFENMIYHGSGNDVECIIPLAL